MIDLPVSRRSLVQAATAALGAVSLPVATSALAAPAGPDDALIALIDRHDIVDAEYQVLSERWDKLHTRWMEERPARPAALTARRDDGLGARPVRLAHPGKRSELVYFDDEVEQIRATTPKPKWIGSNDPCPRAVVRRAEILTAFDRWKAECDAVSDRIGVPDVEARATALRPIVEAIETDIMAFRPCTLAGFVAKAKWVDNQEPADGWPEQIVADLCALNLTT